MVINIVILIPISNIFLELFIPFLFRFFSIFWDWRSVQKYLLFPVITWLPFTWINLRSKSMLWETRSDFPIKRSKAGRISCIVGDPFTISSVMPLILVISGGMGFWGLTKVSNFSVAFPSTNRMAESWIIRSLPAESPVVSTSKATKLGYFPLQ